MTNVKLSSVAKHNRKIFYQWLVANYGIDVKKAFIRNRRSSLLEKPQISTRNEVFYSQLAKNPKSIVDIAFIWDFTKEGHNFWAGIDANFLYASSRLNWKKP